MYLYLGENTVINTRQILGIFDLDNTTISPITREYLAEAQQKNRVFEVSYELPKSFVICQEDNEITVYLSQISPATLEKRLNKRQVL